jgi:hypothetical protein
MFGCDDVVFKDFADISYSLSLLSFKNDLFGFSLRLGKNITPMVSRYRQAESHVEWDWQDADAESWNYPWELDATIYRKKDVISILSKLEPQKIKNPNFFEAEVAARLGNFIWKRGLGAFNKSKCIVITINRVQDDFLNSYDTTFNTDVSALAKLYEDGCRIDYIAISKKKNSRIHVGIAYFKLSGKNLPYNSLQIYLSIALNKIQSLSKRALRKIAFRSFV